MTKPNQTAAATRTDRDDGPIVVHLDDDRQFLTLTEQLLGRYAPALRYRGVTSVAGLEERLADADCVVVDHGARGVDAAAVLSSPSVAAVPVVVFGDPDVLRDEAVRNVADASVSKGRGLDPFERLAATLWRVTRAEPSETGEPAVDAE